MGKFALFLILMSVSPVFGAESQRAVPKWWQEVLQECWIKSNYQPKPYQACVDKEVARRVGREAASFDLKRPENDWLWFRQRG